MMSAIKRRRQMGKGSIILFIVLTCSTTIIQSEKTFDEIKNYLKSQQNIFTCENKCGQVIALPCSCDERCLVHNNCCQYIEIHCAPTLINARQMYGYLLDSDVICHESGVFMISSCPKRNSTIHKRTAQETMNNDGRIHMSSIDTTQKSTHESSEFLEETTEAHNRFLSTVANDVDPQKEKAEQRTIEKIITDAPITDTSNGFTFLGSDVFECNGGVYSNFVRWDVEASVMVYDIPASLQELEEVIGTAKIAYRAPNQLKSPASRCRPTSRGPESCIEETIQGDPGLLASCQDSISYIYVPPKYIYNNQYCLRCSKPENIPIEYVDDDGTYVISGIGMGQFSILMSFEEDAAITLEAKSYVYTPLAVKKSTIPWSSGMCRVPPLLRIGYDRKKIDKMTSQTLFEDEHLGECSILTCEAGFELRPDGKCKTLHNTLIGIADNGFPLTSVERRTLSSFIACGLEEVFGIEIKYVNEQVLTVTYDSMNRLIFVANVSTFLTHYSAARGIFVGSSWENDLVKLSNFVKAFKEFRKPRKQSRCNNITVERHLGDNAASADVRPIPSESDVLKFASYTSMFSSLRGDFQRARGSIIDNSTSSLCMVTSPVKLNELDLLLCLEDPVYESDNHMISEFCNSQCFSVFDVDENNLGNSFGIILSEWKPIFSLAIMALIVLLCDISLP